MMIVKRQKKMTDQNNINDFEKIINTDFDNKLLIKEALTHRSFLNENPSWATPHNERLEYLGDAVLELVVTEHIYDKFEDYDEGLLTSIRAALVNHIMLSRVAEELKLEEFIKLSKGEARGSKKARESILADAVEAIIGAIYLDKGYSEAKKFINDFILSHLKEVMEKSLYTDPKSLLQEVVQEKEKVTPTYKVLSEKGPDHNKEFLIGVFFGEKKVAEGKGASKQEAQRNAAEKALKKIE